MDNILSRETIVKLSKKPFIPETTLKIIIGNPKFFVPRPQKPEEKIRSSSQSVKDKRGGNEKDNVANQPIMTNKYSLALLTAPKQPKPVEQPIQEKKNIDIEEVWKIMYQDEVWNFNATDKVYRFIKDNFTDAKGVCIENIKTGVLYTKNKFIELFGEKASQPIVTIESNPVKLQVNDNKKITKFDELIQDSDDENEYLSDNEQQYNKVEDVYNNRRMQQQKQPTNNYGDYNVLKYGTINKQEQQKQVNSYANMNIMENKFNPKNAKEISNMGNKQQRVEEKVPNKNRAMDYEQLQRQTNTNRYQNQQNNDYLREQDIYRVLEGSDNEDYEEYDYQENRLENDYFNPNLKNNFESAPKPGSDDRDKKIFENMGPNQGMNNNFIELEKLLDAYNVVDHDTFLLELRRYISINKVTDIGFTVPNPAKNIDFEVDIDNSDNEVEHKMAQIQIDQCINKLLSEYIKLTINAVKKLEMKNKQIKSNKDAKIVQNVKNDFIITKVLDEESIKKLLQREDLANKKIVGAPNPQYIQELPRHKQVPAQNPPQKYKMEYERNREAMNPNPPVQDYQQQQKYQPNMYNKYGISEISKMSKPQNVPRSYNNQQPVGRIMNKEQPRNKPGDKRDINIPKEYPPNNYKYY